MGMANIIRRPGWYIPERYVTPESVFRNRRQFLKELGFVGGAALISPHLGAAAEATKKYPFARNKEFDPGGVKLTDEKVAATYNNFYEFSTTKERVHKLTDKFVIDPWPIEIGGLVEKPMKVDVKELVEMMPMEERVYRFRCVEAWAMTVPWTGFPISKLLEKVSPKPEAKFIRFQTFFRPAEAPGFADKSYPWPYTEGLRIEEAMNPLALFVTGIYGKPLPKQHGAPIRVIVPWKYGYKSIKSIVKIEFVDKQPSTLWETLAPNEYPFESNVNPEVPHPRWSQSTERIIDTGARVRTKIYNGYGDYVAKLYKA
jgi:sulfoxide reductase catalytic subunit YedY